MTHTIPQSFRVRKDNILSDLSTPDSEYTDKSPKGSIDEPIRGLIALINSYPGWCTTSSCSGRVAVFVEGSKSPSKLDEQVDSHEGEIKSKKVKTGPGGKGGGRWLFVSHDPIQGKDTQQLALEQEAASEVFTANACASPRLVSLTFSPLILHVLCASLYHAKPLLAAAINAGFRESGVQSLKALEDSEVGVMVAIRTAGIAFSSMVGVGEDEGEEGVVRIVSDEYLKLCIGVVNARFEANEERKARLEDELKSVVDTEREAVDGQGESKEERRERKRAEGLKKQQEQKDVAAKVIGHWSKDEDHDSRIEVLNVGDVFATITSSYEHESPPK